MALHKEIESRVHTEAAHEVEDFDEEGRKLLAQLDAEGGHSSYHLLDCVYRDETWGSCVHWWIAGFQGP